MIVIWSAEDIKASVSIMEGLRWRFALSFGLSVYDMLIPTEAQLN